jgi:diguanylate cyclase (GGDEF)-like protein/PAS domain S-box-containing protein
MMNDPYRSIVQVSRDYITLIDASLRYQFVNKAYLHVLGKSKSEVEGHTVEEIWGKARFEGAIEVPLRRCLDGEEVHFIDEFPFGETVKYVEVRFFPYREEKHGPVTHALVISHDISRLGELETRLMAYEFRDPATGLFNRRSLDIILEREVQKADISDDSHLRVLFLISVENLSDIRRQHGSGIATHVMENTGLRMKSHLCKEDSIFRCESDELAALVTHLHSPEDSASLAESLLAVVSTPYPKGLYEIRPECRMGIAMYPRDAQKAEDLIERAEAALSTARDGGFTFHLYDGELHARSVAKLRLIAQLRRAVYEDRFELHFQPIVDAAGAIHGAECLIRWRHPELGLLMPGRFIHLAEETGLNMEMEKQVIFSAARHLARWKKYGIYLSINLSARMFESDELLNLLETALVQAGGVENSRLKLEITESEGMSNAGTVIERMKELSGRGFGIYIDDFGTGQSSLRYLKDLPASVLKIDRAFVNGIERSEEDRHFLGHIIELIKDRHRYSVVEGVENEFQATLLAGMDVDALQGFYFSRPVAAEVFEDMLKEGRSLPLT